MANYGGDAGGGHMGPYWRRQLGIDPKLNPLLVRALVARGVHVSGVNDNTYGHNQFNLEPMGGGMSAIPEQPRGAIGGAFEGAGGSDVGGQMNPAALAALQARLGGGRFLGPPQRTATPLPLHARDQQRVANVAQGLMRRLMMHRQLQGLLRQGGPPPAQVNPQSPYGYTVGGGGGGVVM